MPDCKDALNGAKGATSRHASRSGRLDQPLISPAQSASYTEGMLCALEKIAVAHNQHILAHLIALAAVEAGMLANPKNGYF
ncbi:MAG: hypothetical protein WCD42_03290 [Rhizomicrobium sp.]